MIKEIKITTPNKYGRFFLATEADDEETPAPKSRTKVINVKPNNRNRIDFTDGASETDETPEPSEETPDTTTDDTSDDDFTDDTTDTSDIDTSDDTGNGDDDFTDDATGDDSTTDDTSNDTGDNTDDETGGEDDFTDGASDDDSSSDGDTSNDDNGDQQNDGDKKGPGVEYDSTRKFNLFENFVSLSNALTNYIEKLEGQMGEDYNKNQVIKTVTEKLRNIKKLCDEYITMKFELSTYVQSLLFFQNLIVMVQLNFTLLDTFNKKTTKITIK